MPLTFGGGIHSADQVQRLLRAGADKVSLNTATFETPDLVTQIAKRHGSQCVIASLDVRPTDGRTGQWTCFSHAGTYDTGQDAVEWAKRMEDCGAGEILLTSIPLDGTFEGYDLDLISAVTSAISIPVIASGGAGNYEHMVDAVLQANASAVAAASMFHFTEATPAEAKTALAAAGIPTRVSDT